MPTAHASSFDPISRSLAIAFSAVLIAVVFTETMNSTAHASVSARPGLVRVGVCPDAGW